MLRKTQPQFSHIQILIDMLNRVVIHKSNIIPKQARKLTTYTPGYLTQSRRYVKSSALQMEQKQQEVSSTDYFATDERPIILFDGVCNVCNGGVNMVLAWDGAGVFRMAALQSDAGRALLQRCGRSPEDISSMVLVEKDKCHIRSEAVLRIAEKLNIPFPIFSTFLLPLPRSIRDSAYDQFAKYRYDLFGKRNQCRLMDDRYKDRFIEA
eukprot:TRINITY_DN322_c0_g1_i1.p3 TRINITY_DN322_c0_g1~~TRINITY_DN322_c0_g1_i1.p3  ORF type:complete len:209 (+),score=23.03 TRINITY_DN322_c0_g1_i1:3-629(+)